MHKSIKNEITKWEISILEIQNHKGSKFKVTRRLPEMFVAETRIFRCPFCSSALSNQGFFTHSTRSSKAN